MKTEKLEAATLNGGPHGSFSTDIEIGMTLGLEHVYGGPHGSLSTDIEIGVTLGVKLGSILLLTYGISILNCKTHNFF